MAPLGLFRVTDHLHAATVNPHHGLQTRVVALVGSNKVCAVDELSLVMLGMDLGINANTSVILLATTIGDPKITSSELLATAGHVLLDLTATHLTWIVVHFVVQVV